LSGKAERVLLGEIGAAQGLKGEVRLRSYTEDPAAIGSYGPFEDESGASVEFESMRATPKGIVARLRGVTTREAAEALTGTRLYVPRARLPERGQDEWYHADLIGLAARSKDGTPLGTVVAVVNFGAGDLIEIAPAESGANLLVPFTETNVPEIDLAARRLVLVPPEEVE
jgi:16S rRNA processing protein RimM